MFLYTPAPLAVNLRLGAKYDQRARSDSRPPTEGCTSERGASCSAESYLKWEQEFVSFQNAYNITFGFLAVPEWLMVAFDYEFKAEPYEDIPETFETDLKKIGTRTASGSPPISTSTRTSVS